MCEKIEAYDDETRKFVWYISVNDFLPRKYEQIIAGGAGNAISIVANITKIDTNAQLKVNDLAIETPHGYARESAQRPSREPLAVPDMGLPTGTQAPAFTLGTTDGATVSLGDLRGQVVVLNFWGPRYTQAVEGNSKLAGIADVLAEQNVAVLCMTCRESDLETIKKTEETWPDGFTALIGADALMKEYKVLGCPSYYVINAEGNVSEFFQGFPGVEALTAAVTKASMNDMSP